MEVNLINLEFNRKKLSGALVLVLLMLALPTVGANYAGPIYFSVIGDQVWNDLNEDGVQDAGEPGISNVTVGLYDRNGNFLTSKSTDANGLYRFTVMPGNYYLNFTLPSGMVFSPVNQGTNDTVDSDADNVTGLTACTALVPGEIDLSWDAGMYCITSPGTGTSGYWKNHPEAWPVDEITIGGEIYTKEESIGIMKMPGGDKSYTMFRALVSAKLNVLIGNDDSCIADTISEADVWMEAYGPAGSGIRAKSDAWKEGKLLSNELDDYNNGKLPCAFSRD
ncbi:MAG: hypothetical protein K8R53_00445 [Bacteroidales bacterium]|nr:hypothetical protein [Bacteroidales bacterium]